MCCSSAHAGQHMCSTAHSHAAQGPCTHPQGTLPPAGCLQAVGHSLGAACLLMYTVGRRMMGQPHRIRRRAKPSPWAVAPGSLCSLCLCLLIAGRWLGPG